MKHTTNRKTVTVVIGTRPEAIKLSPVIQTLRERADVFKVKLIVTAQHREMIDQVLPIFNIKPDFDLNVMKRNQTLHELTANILTKIRGVFRIISPSIVLVQGDTTTTFASALAAFYDKIPVGHIEAGLRTHVRYYPFPEEMDRKLVSALATFHFAPTERAADALRKEGIDSRDIFVTGNTVVDALHQVVISNNKESRFPFLDGKDKIVLVTAHRRENLNGGLELICRSIKDLLKIEQDAVVVFPLHLNPQVQQVIRKNLSNHKRVFLCEPLDYRSFISIMQRVQLILTDSGGIQEEAPSIGVPVVVLRNETERVEAIESGLVAIAGLNPKEIVEKSLQFLKKSRENVMNNDNPYGDGKASKRIVSILLKLTRAGKLD